MFALFILLFREAFSYNTNKIFCIIYNDIDNKNYF